ncbi:MAG: ABC transporter substrate-binding protein [Candidatus Korobacteraceae bacterium]|jgi:branched-chain amino acid transport system substrate-binding protein
MKDKWAWGFVLALVLSLSFLTSCTGSSGKTIKIGHAASLTGDNSVFGQSEATGLKIAVEELNKRGGILGKKVELVSMDTRSDPAEAANAVRRLVDEEKVNFVLGPSQSGSTLAATPIVTAAKIPLIAAAASNPYVTVSKAGVTYKYIFRVCFIDTYQGIVIADFVYDRLKARKAAILYDIGSDYSQWLAKYFEDAFVKRGGTILAKEAYRTGELDFRAPLGKIKETHPDIIFLPLTQKDGALAAKQVRDLGITATIMGSDTWASPDILPLGGKALEGVYFTNLTSFEVPKVQQWVAQNEKRFGGPIVRNALLVNDALLWLADAVNRAGTTDGDKVVTALEQTKDLPVLTTDKFTIDPKTHDPLNRPAFFFTIKDGKFIFVETYAARSVSN